MVRVARRPEKRRRAEIPRRSAGARTGRARQLSDSEPRLLLNRALHLSGHHKRDGGRSDGRWPRQWPCMRPMAALV
eukprot:scaffold51535_cov32-Tisochrysis_lutea.AAC.1